MTLPEDLIMEHLDWHLNQSQPGHLLHQLTTIAAPLTPLGLPDETATQTSLYGIAAGSPGEATQLFAEAMALAAGEATKAGQTIVFAALSQEIWALPKDTTDKELGIRLLREGKPLGDHPEAVELTLIYAAIADGRRWRGRRFLTGPRAGQTEGVELLVGRPRQGESHGVPGGRQLRQLVGQAG